MPRVCILGIDIIDCIKRITTPHPLNSKSISPAACRCSACNWNIDKRLARKLVWLRARD